MADPLSTDDGLAKDSFETLEDRLKNTDRDFDNEHKSSVYLSKVCVSQCQVIESEVDTNRIEVLLRAYTEGICELRQLNFGERSNEVYNIVAKTNEITQHSRELSKRAQNIRFRSDAFEVHIGREDVYLEDSPTGVRIRDSIYSEVKKRFDDILVFKPGVIRPILIVGLSRSEYCTGAVESLSEEIIEKIDDGIEEARYYAEKSFAQSISHLLGYFLTEGIDGVQIDRLNHIVGIMETEYEDEVRSMINVIEENCDVY